MSMHNRIATLEAKAEEAKKKLDEINAQKKALKARLQARETAEERKRDTRRKVLLGAFVLEQMKRAHVSAKDMSIGSGRFADWLTRPEDRALFDLPPTPPLPSIEEA